MEARSQVFVEGLDEPLSVIESAIEVGNQACRESVLLLHEAEPGQPMVVVKASRFIMAREVS